MRPAFGMVIVISSILGGYAALGGNLGVLWNPFEIVIICGSAMGAFVIANPTKLLKDTAQGIGQLGRGRRFKKAEYLELLSLLFAIVKQARTRGLMQMEKDIEQPFESALFANYPTVLAHKKGITFLTDYLRLISLGTEKSFEIETLMDEEIDVITRDRTKAPKALKALGESLPALGIVAAVLGVIKAMSALNQPPDILGALIAGALVGTFLGVLLSYGLVSPLAMAIRSDREDEMMYFQCIRSGLGAYLRGDPPQICVEFARKVLPESAQPAFDEVEAAIKTTMLPNQTTASAA